MDTHRVDRREKKTHFLYFRAVNAYYTTPKKLINKNNGNLRVL
jgi:hypothetical protein